jgi:hypothetical protein
MHVNSSTALIGMALVGAVVLAMKPDGGRFIPAVALVTATLAVLIDYRIIQISAAKLRIDVIIPAVLVVTGGLMWRRSSSKPAITAASLVTIAGLIMLLSALRVLR